MMGWGRNATNAATVASASRPVRHGACSIILALIAPVIVLAAFSYLVNLPKAAPEEDLAVLLALASYGLVAPALHIAGVGFGIAGIRNPAASKPASIVGILLNIGLVVLGIVLGWAALKGMAAFT